MPRTRLSIPVASLALSRNLDFAAVHVPGCRGPVRAL